MNPNEKEWITNFLHSFPHVTFSFHSTNSTFNPDDSHYRESIIFVSVLPLVLCVLFLLISLCCTCYQCKKQRPQKRVKACCPGGIIGVILFVSLAASGLGLYGNEKANGGVESFDDAIKDVNTTLTDALESINSVHDIANKLADRNIKDLQDTLNKHIFNTTIKTKLGEITNEMLENSNKARSDINNIMTITPNVSLDFITTKTAEGEFVRWTATVVVLSLVLFLILFSLCGCCKRSRCLLATSICMGFLALLVAWVLCGIYLGGSVTNADLCVDPENFIENEVNSKVERDILKNYIECKKGGSDSKYTEDVKEAIEAVTRANDSLSQIINITFNLKIYNMVEKPITTVITQLNWGFGNLTALSNVFQCQRTHDNYLKIKKAVCDTVLFNVFLLLSAFLLLSLMLSMLQCLLPKMWYISGKRQGSGYRPVDDTDPFVPRPPPYQDYGALYGPQGLSNSDAINMTGGPPLDSPPPAYSARVISERRQRTSSLSSIEN